ncbi:MULTISPECIES: ASCH domain-containing protein [Clostridium]|uniref:ASCH domain-containing protein n=2 Tax=Clostridium TaxID=1485 RepID=A0A1A6B360_9CLOT|nr:MULTISPECIES: ASCH domain-containing protein [Clostridium]OBR96727.1 hypothetical protein CLRAG_02350 [Clostridium ragsdalei P11]QXE18286.1 hypothetical protein B5S50_05230 [Clostridium sp. 001]RMC96025.1 hypothetical protein D9O40_16250 [Clostridium autoethanogenum]
MVHTMRLQEKYFDLIRLNRKIIEVRLNDTKRKSLSINDIIIFFKMSNHSESIKVSVDKITKFSSFKCLLSQIDIKDLGISKKDKNVFLQELSSIYSSADEKQLGVLGIKFHILD